MNKRIGAGLCPVCELLLPDIGAFDGDASPPQPGDLMVCEGCVAVLRFFRFDDGALVLAAVPAWEREQLLDDDPDLADAIEAVQAWRRANLS